MYNLTYKYYFIFQCYSSCFGKSQGHKVYYSPAIKSLSVGPGWGGSVDWVQASEPKCCWFGSQSGHMPGLWARSPEGGTWQATTHSCFSPSLSPSLPPQINKVFKKKRAWALDWSNFNLLCHLPAVWSLGRGFHIC